MMSARAQSLSTVLTVTWTIKDPLTSSWAIFAALSRLRKLGSADSDILNEKTLFIEKPPQMLA